MIYINERTIFPNQQIKKVTHHFLKKVFISKNIYQYSSFDYGNKISNNYGRFDDSGRG